MDAKHALSAFFEQLAEAFFGEPETSRHKVSGNESLRTAQMDIGGEYRSLGFLIVSRLCLPP